MKPLGRVLQGMQAGGRSRWTVWGWSAWLLMVAVASFSAHRAFDHLYEEEAMLLAGQHEVALSVAYQAAAATHQREVATLLRADVLRPDVLQLWTQASEAPDDGLPILRGRLYRALAESYARMEVDGMRQLHLHWADGRSLLRMHQPDRFGDGLFDIRPSVRLANTHHRSVHGFEGGRVLPGFRHVYPVWSTSGKHLGSVELSLPFETLHAHMSSLLPQSTITMLLDRRVSSDMVFGQMASHFVPSGLSDRYVRENPDVSRVTRRYLESDQAIALTNSLAGLPEVRGGLRSERSFSLPLLHRNEGVVASFHALSDVEGKHAAYVVAYTPLPELAALSLTRQVHAMLAALGTMALGGLSGLLWWQWRRQRAQSQELAIITEKMADGLYVMDASGSAVYVNHAACSMLGYSAGELLGRQIHETIHQHGHNHQLPLELCPIHATTVRGHPFAGTEWFRRKNGTVFEADVRSMPMQSASRERASVTLFRDLTGQRQSEMSLRQAASVFEHAHEGICIADVQARIVDTNEAFGLITGYARDEVLGRNPSMLSSGRQSPEFYKLMWGELNSHGHWRGEVWNRHKGGAAYAALLTVTAVKGADGVVQSYVGILSDITALKLHEEELERIALYDPLTGIANRRLLDERMDHALAQARRRNSRVALMVLDLDGFKAVNDQYGHEAGDRLLVEVCRRLELCLRQTDTLARIGGDEFVLLLTDLHSSDDRHWHEVAARVLQVVAQPVTDGEHNLHVSCSLGVTIFPDDDAGPDALMRHADQAMYQAKQAGKNGYRVFQPS